MTGAPQHTLARAVEFKGRGLYHGAPAHLICRPAPAGHGVALRLVHLPGSPLIPANVGAVAAADRRIVLGKDKNQTALVEHLLAAAAGLGVDNLLIEIDSPEVPLLDGSAQPYVKAFLDAGLEAQNSPRRIFRPSTAISLADGEAAISLVPLDSPDALILAYELDYGDRFLGRQHLEITLAPEIFTEQIAPARTYVLRPEIVEFQRRGFGAGATAENVVIIEEDGLSPTPLRFPDECIRHKLLDLVGDLSLSGCVVRGRVFARKAGHRIHIQLARAIAELAARRL